MPYRRYLLLLAVSLVVSVLVTVNTFLESEGWVRRRAVLRDLNVIETDIAETSAKVKELQARIKAQKTRLDVQEHIVRDELGYVRPGEIVLDLNNPR